MNDPTRAILERLEQRGFAPRSVGPDSWESRCPAHDGGRNNLSIRIGDDGRCLIHCHHVDEAGAGCSTGAILSAIGLTLADLFMLDVAGGRVAKSGQVLRPAGKARVRKVHPTFQAAVDAVLWGLRLSRDGKSDASWRAQARWVYHAAAGSETFSVVRFQNAAGDAGDKGGKDYRPIHPSGSGFAIGDPPGLLPLYRLPELTGCRRVYLPEGEKCVDLVWRIELPATTPSHGAKSPHKSDWTPLAGTEVIILPDADAPGEGFANGIVAQLAKLQPAPTIRIVRLPKLAAGEDIEQWLAARVDDPARDGPWRAEARAELERLADSAPLEAIRAPKASGPAGQAGSCGVGDGPRLAPGEAFDRAASGGVAKDGAEEISVPFATPAGQATPISPDAIGSGSREEVGEPVDWSGDPRPLRSQLPTVPLMHEVMIPGPFRGWLDDIAQRVGCSLDFPVIGAVISAAALVGRRVAIRPKRYDDWSVVPNLWGAIVGRPGVLKTPALLEATRPLRRLVKEAEDRHTEAVTAFQAESLVAKVQAEAAREALKKAVKQDLAPAEIAEFARQATAADGLAEPPWRRYLVNDPTVEKLGELLRDNPLGLLHFRDELSGWLRLLDKPGRENDRSFYLEAWNGGAASYTYDRIGRGTIVIPSPCMSILGGIQPGPLRSYLKAIQRGEDGDDGLISRFQLLVYPDPPAEWRNVDRWPDSDAKNRAFAIFRALDALDPASLFAEADDHDGPPFLRFSAGAQDLFDEWRAGLENGKLRVEGESPMIESHLAKYRSLMPSLALVFHLIECVGGRTGGPVSLEAAELAAGWCDYMEAHARRVYASVRETDLDAARSLAERIKAGAVTSPFSPRDVYRRCWSNLSTPDEVNRAVALLEEHDWVRSVETRQTGGAPRTDVHVHPTVAATRRAG